MKTMPKILTLCLAAALTACATPRVRVTSYTDATFPATDRVALLDALPTGRPYVRLGTLQVAAREGAIEALRVKAQEVGADALVIVGEYEVVTSTQAVYVDPNAGTRYQGWITSSHETPVRRTYLRAVAIRWTTHALPLAERAPQ